MTGFNKDANGYWIEKDPSAILDYSMDWSEWLQVGETIVSSNWTAAIGLTIDSTENTASKATAWLSGGVIGKEYFVTNRITTSDGRQDERSFRIIVKNR